MNNRVKNISTTYGLLTGGAFIIFFLLLSIVGWHEKPWLRVFNGVILAGGVLLSIKEYRKATGNYMKYYSGFRTGLFTGFIATLTFMLFMAIYMFVLDTDFHMRIMKTWFAEYSQGPVLLLFVIFVEGLSSSMILTLITMQGQKTSWNSRFSKKVHQNV